MNKLIKFLIIPFLGLIIMLPGCSKKEEPTVDPTPVEPTPTTPTKTVEEVKLDTKVELLENYNDSSTNISNDDKLIYSLVYQVLIKDIDELDSDIDNIQNKCDEIINTFNDVTNSFKNPTSDLKQYALNQLEIVKEYGLKYLGTTNKDELSNIINEYKNIINSVDTDQIKDILNEFKLSIIVLLEDYVDLAIDNFKAYLKEELDYVVKSIINKIDDSVLKETLEEYYKLKETAINALKTFNDCKNYIKTVKEDAKIYALDIAKQQINKYKAIVLDKLDNVFNNTINKLEDSNLKQTLTKSYNDAKTLLDNDYDIDTYKDELNIIYDNLYNNVKKDVKVYVYNNAKVELDNFANTTINKITNQTLKEGCLKTYNDALKDLDAIEYSDNYSDQVKALYTNAINNIKDTIVNFLKKDCKDKLDLVITNTIAKVDNQTIKDGLTKTYEDAIKDLEELVYSNEIEESVNNLYTNFYNNVVDTIKTYLKNDYLTKLNDIFDTYIDKVDNQTIKDGLTKTYEDAIKDVEDLIYTDNYKEDLNTLYTNLLDNVKSTIVNFLKKDCKDKLDTLFNDSISNIENETIKETLTKSYNDACDDLELLEYSDDIESVLTKLYQDVLDDIDEGMKQLVKDEIDKYVDKANIVYTNLTKGLSKDSKDLLQSTYNTFVQDINDVNKIEDVKPVFNKFTEDVKNLAIEYFNNIKNKLEFNPNIWSYLPSTYKTTYQLTNDTVIPTYEDFTNISDIPSIYMGKQLNTVYKVLNKLEFYTSILSQISNCLGNIGTAYDSIFDSSKSDDIVIEFANFTLTIKIDENSTTLDATISNGSIHMYKDENGYGAKLNIGTNTIKYDITSTQTIIAIDISSYITTQLIFAKDSSSHTYGYIYDTVNVSGVGKSTTAYLYIDDNYTYVVGNNGDFIADCQDGVNCEIYDNSNAKFVGSEVYEKDSSDKVYNTIWLNLSDISGINSIKKEDTKNGLNPDKIWINESEDTIHTMNVVKINPLSSRRFDIEYKTVYSYKLNSETNEYETIEFEVPLMFIQEEFVSSFSSDFESKNSKSVEEDSISILTTQDVFNAIEYGYDTLVNNYRDIKDSVTYDNIKLYLGLVEE